MLINEIRKLTEGNNTSKDHFITDIEKETINNKNFRKVLFTGKNEQLVVMSIPPNGEIGMETHDTIDQFIRVEAGTGKVIFNEKEFPIKDGSAFIISQGTKHNVMNTSNSDDLKMYTVYSPPNHKDGTVHKTKKDADTNEGHADEKID